MRARVGLEELAYSFAAFTALNIGRKGRALEDVRGHDHR
jgi:hypothetical protein